MWISVPPWHHTSSQRWEDQTFQDTTSRLFAFSLPEDTAQTVFKIQTQRASLFLFFYVLKIKRWHHPQFAAALQDPSTFCCRPGSAEANRNTRICVCCIIIIIIISSTPGCGGGNRREGNRFRCSRADRDWRRRNRWELEEAEEETTQVCVFLYKVPNRIIKLRRWKHNSLWS